MLCQSKTELTQNEKLFSEVAIMRGALVFKTKNRFSRDAKPGSFLIAVVAGSANTNLSNTAGEGFHLLLLIKKAHATKLNRSR